MRTTKLGLTSDAYVLWKRPFPKSINSGRSICGGMGRGELKTWGWGIGPSKVDFQEKYGSPFQTLHSGFRNKKHGKPPYSVPYFLFLALGLPVINLPQVDEGDTTSDSEDESSL